MSVERIAVKGSARAAIRTNLYRKAAKDADWIKGRKFRHPVLLRPRVHGIHLRLA